MLKSPCTLTTTVDLPFLTLHNLRPTPSLRKLPSAHTYRQGAYLHIKSLAALTDCRGRNRSCVFAARLESCDSVSHADSSKLSNGLRNSPTRKTSAETDRGAELWVWNLVCRSFWKGTTAVRSPSMRWRPVLHRDRGKQVRNGLSG